MKAKRNKPQDDLKPIGEFIEKWRPELEAMLASSKDEPQKAPYVYVPPPPWYGLGIPKAFHHAKLEDFPGMAFERESMFIFGPNGTGKTHLAAALCIAWQARWTEVFPLLARVKSTFNGRSEESEQGVLEELLRPEVLILDDLWAGNKSDFAFSWLMGLINGRMVEERATIVTCDRGLAEIRGVDSSLASRLASFRQVKLGGKDRRVRGA